MNRVLVLQIDNRRRLTCTSSKSLEIPPKCADPELLTLINNGLTQSVNFWSISSLVNEFRCHLMGWNYQWLEADPIERHLTWNKVRELMKRLPLPDADLILYLDSDAWIRDAETLAKILLTFAESPQYLAFARDPDLPGNTSINTGCILMKNDYRAAEFWRHVWELPINDPELYIYTHQWCHEQRIVDFLIRGKYAHDVSILPLDAMNSPCGSVVRHCWWKEECRELLIDEMFAILCKLVTDRRKSLGSDPTQAAMGSHDF